MKVVNVTTGEEVQPKIVERAPYDYLQDEITGLAGDVLSLGIDVDEHEDVLQMLGEKIQAIEDDQLQDIKNLSSVVDVLECLQEANKMMLDLIVSQNEQNKILKDEIKGVDNAGICLFRFLVIWNVVLTVLFGIYVF